MTLPPGVVYYPAPPAQPQPAAPPYAAGGYVPVPQAAPQPPQWSPQPAAPVAPAQPRQFGLDDVLPADPTIPPELHGRTLRQAVGYYGVLRQAAARARTAPQPGAPQAQAPASTAGGYQGQPQQPGDDPRASFYADPRAAIRQAVAEVMAPVTAQTQDQAIVQAVQAARGSIPQGAWQALEADIMAVAQVTPREQLTSPDAWLTIANYVAGKRALGAAPQSQPQQPPNGQPGYRPSGSPEALLASSPLPAPYAAPQAQPQPAAYQYFTEAPTGRPAAAPPGYGANGAPDPKLAQKQEVARRFGLPFNEYAAWDHAQVPGETNGSASGPQGAAPPGYVWAQGNGQWFLMQAGAQPGAQYGR